MKWHQSICTCACVPKPCHQSICCCDKRTPFPKSHLPFLYFSSCLEGSDAPLPVQECCRFSSSFVQKAACSVCTDLAHQRVWCVYTLLHPFLCGLICSAASPVLLRVCVVFGTMWQPSHACCHPQRRMYDVCNHHVCGLIAVVQFWQRVALHTLRRHAPDLAESEAEPIWNKKQQAATQLPMHTRIYLWCSSSTFRHKTSSDRCSLFNRSQHPRARSTCSAVQCSHNHKHLQLV